MCLAAWSVAQHPRFPWVLASNRDEFFDRAASPLAWWSPEPGAPRLLGGRDSAGGGSWLALRDDGRLALLTNVREPGRFEAAWPSRGRLVVDALLAARADDHWLSAAMSVPRNGCNLIVADLAGDRFAWAGNRPLATTSGGAGVWGLSNAALDTPWPKVQALKRQLHDAVRSATDPDALIEAAFTALASRAVAAEADLPHTGIPRARERALSPAFIRIDSGEGFATYGTRCSTVCIVEDGSDGRHVRVVERSFDPAGGLAGEVRHAFALCAP